MSIQSNNHKRMKDSVARLYELSIQADDKEWGKTDQDFCSNYSLASEKGRKLYSCLTDDLLLKILKENAKRLGHAPAQKEIFWVWREYIKLRFKKWPYALVLAGLPKGAGSGGLSMERIQRIDMKKRQIIDRVTACAIRLGRIPHPNDLPNIMEELMGIRCGWDEIISDAGLDQNFFEKYTLEKIPDLEAEYIELLDGITKLSVELGRAPRRHEVEAQAKEKLVARCGTWRNALYQIGLEPVRSIHPFASAYSKHSHGKKSIYHKKSLYDCYYRVLNIDDQTKKDLGLVKRIEERLGRIPDRGDVPKDIRQRLQEKCGSWSNVLYQLQYIDE